MIDKSIQTYLFNKIMKRAVLKEGLFKLNIGEQSKYYYDFSAFTNPSGIHELGFIFWETIKNISKENNKYIKEVVPDVVVGVATKGIVLAMAASTYAWTFADKHIDFAFDRKEEKKHGEMGYLVGCDITNKSVILVDDVIDSGLAMTRTLNTVRRFTNDIKILVMINRSGIKELQGFPILYILSHNEVLERIAKNEHH